MSKSIMQSNPEYCYIHMKYLGAYAQACDEHHVCHGTARRRLAEEDGLKVYLCRSCHTLLHDRNYHDIDLLQEAERTWLEYYGKTKEEWIERYTKNYLD